MPKYQQFVCFLYKVCHIAGFIDLLNTHFKRNWLIFVKFFERASVY